MATEETYDRLRSLTGTTVETHDDETLDVYLEESLVPDDEGRKPGDSDYELTYDLHRAAARVFRDLAASVARTAFTLQADQTRAERQEILDNYVHMARWHERLAKPRFARLSEWPLDTFEEPEDNVSVDA